MDYEYRSLKKKTDKDNRTGTKKRVFVGPRSKFLVLATPVDPPVNPGDSVRISADHTFDVGEGFIELYTTLDTSSLTAESLGERDNRGDNPKIECFHPGIYPEVLEFRKQARNDDWIALVEMLDGTIVQLGEDGLECDITAAVGSGTVSSGRKGVTFTIESFSDIFIYEGQITLKPVV